MPDDPTPTESRRFERQAVADTVLRHSDNLEAAADELNVTIPQLKQMMAEFEGNDSLKYVTL